MFSGIVEKVGRVVNLQKSQTGLLLGIWVSWPKRKFRLGDSIAVNGSCLTLTKKSGPTFSFFISHETLARTNFQTLKMGDVVHLEASVTPQTTLDGHLVQGHVECVAPLVARKKMGASLEIRILLPKAFAPLVIEKGSIALDGVSLTINKIRDLKGGCEIAINLIPHTLKATNLGGKPIGSFINVETDVFGRYVQRHLQLQKR